MTGRTPAWYAQRGGRAADLVTLLHIPYTAWHLGYVAIGAALAPVIEWRVLVGTLLAFAVGLGVSAHALDELHGRPLRTGLSDGQLVGLAVAGFVIVGASVGRRSHARLALDPGVGCRGNPHLGRIQPGMDPGTPHPRRVRARLGRIPGAGRLLGADQVVLGRVAGRRCRLHTLIDGPAGAEHTCPFRAPANRGGFGELRSRDSRLGRRDAARHMGGRPAAARVGVVALAVGLLLTHI